jgi:hypothetical protein
MKDVTFVVFIWYPTVILFFNITNDYIFTIMYLEWGPKKLYQLILRLFYENPLKKSHGFLR